MAGGVAIAKVAVTALSNEKIRKGVGWVVVALLSPIIVITIIICSVMAGGAEHNNAVVELTFNGGMISGNVPEGYRSHIYEMRTVFDGIDSVVVDMNSELDEVHSLDSILVKAVFFAMFFGEPSPNRVDISSFADCFMSEKEITREVMDEDGEVIGTETVTLKVRETDMMTVYNRIATVTGVTADADDIVNANEIYYRLRYNVIPLGQLNYDLPFVGLDGFVEPVADWQSSVSSEYGDRIHPITGVAEFHPAIDIAKPAGTPVYSVLGGVVTVATYHTQYGYYVKINHGGGFETLYAHNYKLLVTAGQTVSAGDMIAQVGTTGTSTGNHLHFEIFVGGQRVNPRAYLPVK